MTVPAVPDVPATFAKSEICWLHIDGRGWPAWYAAVGGTAYIVGGPGEQPLPELPPELPITLRARVGREHAGRFTASATRLRDGDEGWDEAMGALQPARLNSPHGKSAATIEHWATEGVVWAVRPDFGSAAPVGRDSPSGASEPIPTAATTPVRLPRHFGGRRRRDG